MSTLLRILRFFFPPSRWKKCSEPMPWERLAQYERRLGEHRAQERMRDAMVSQAIDAYTSSKVRPWIAPKLPEDRKVIPMRRRRAA